MLLTEKYKPRTLKDVVGQDDTVLALKQLLLKGDSILLWGPVGCGKTSMVYAFCEEFGYELYEFNATSVRNKAAVHDTLNRVISQTSLFGDKKIILIDDVDCLSGVKDRGGIQAMIELMKKSPYPFIFTAQDISDKKFTGLKRSCREVSCVSVSSASLFSFLQHICSKESYTLDESLLKSLARSCEGDVRHALNQLQVMSASSAYVHSFKDHRSALTNYLSLVFKSTNAEAILSSFDGLSENFDDIFLWLDENIAYMYSSSDLGRAYDALSKADIFRSRIRRWQYYRFMVYQKLLMSMGVALANNRPSHSVSSFKRNSRLLKMWIAKRKFQSKDHACSLLSSYAHFSLRKARLEYPYVVSFFDEELVTFLEDSLNF